jgi:hypothetical protein
MPHRRPIELARKLALIACLIGLAAGAEAQRPFVTLDPFYQEETARRGFFDGFALQADLAYRGMQPLVAIGATVSPLALSMRFDYALTQHVDISAVVDASSGFDGSVERAPARISWLIIKPHWRDGQSDYAVRLAVDPAGDGGFGFRQTDLAFVSTTYLSPTLSTDMAVGIRRVRAGFERVEFQDEPVDRASYQLALADDPRPEIIRSRASGTEIHVMWGYRYWLNPSGSHVVTTVSAEGMQYALISTSSVAQDGSALEDAGRGLDSPEGRTWGGMARLNLGIEYSRPSFLLTPHFGLPLFRWIQLPDETVAFGPRADHSRFGLRVTLR